MASLNPEKKLYLVDGTSQLFRAYFAIQGLSNDDGLAKDGNFITGNLNITYDGMVMPWDAPTVADAVALAWQQLTLAEGASTFGNAEVTYENNVVYKLDGATQPPNY